MTPHPALSRRALLTGALGLGGAAGLCALTGGCAYLPSDADANAATTTPLPASAKAEIDGDLVYFNWADYLDPSVFTGFQKEYGVKIVQSNFDSMEGMYAKLQAGNQYDIIFPIAKWVQRLRLEGKLRAIDHGQLANADQVFYSGSYFVDPWYDKDSAVSVPFTVYKTGIGWRTDKVDTMTGSWRDLWNPQAARRIYTLDDQDEALAMGALLLGYDVNTARQNELDEIRRLLLSQRKYLRGYSSDDVNNMVSGNAWIHHMWSGDFLYLRTSLVDKPESYDFQAPKEGVPINSDAYCIPANAQHPGTAMLFIDYLLRPQIARKNILYLSYPLPVRDALPTFQKLAKEVPACNVRLSELESGNVFRNLPADAVQRRTATWTEVRAG